MHKKTRRNKQNMMLDFRKRFHFDPKNQEHKTKSIVANRPSQAITLKENNCEFSSVNEKNDFNDSSWLAKLVNGIEEQNSNNKQILSEIKQTDENLMERPIYTSKNPSFSSIYTIERKGSHVQKEREKEVNKEMERKSLPSAINKKTMKNTAKQSRKLSCQSAHTGNEPKSEPVSYQNERKMSREPGPEKKQKIKVVYPKYTNQNKRRKTSAEKNSVINYSSIKEEAGDEFALEVKEVKQINQPNVEPAVTSQEKKQIIESISKLNLSNYEIRIENSRPQEKQGKLEKQQKSYKLSAQKYEQNSRSIQEDNEFLRPFFSSYAIANPSQPPASQLQNKFSEVILHEINEIQCFQQSIFDEQPRRTEGRSHHSSVNTKFGVIKKNKGKQIVPQKQKQKQIKRSGSKFHYISPFAKEPTAQQNQSILTVKKLGEPSLKKDKFCEVPQIKEDISAFLRVYQKLDERRVGEIWRENCNEAALSEEQKIEYGSILSKIRYLNQRYSSREFLSECCRILGNQTRTQLKMAENESKLNRLSKHMNGPTLVQKNRNVQNALNSENVHIQNLMPVQRQSQPSKNRAFPQVKERLAPSKDPYLQMPSEIQSKVKLREPRDLQSIIDSLNSKLSNYIQQNNLEDTYRKFKLEFIQLRRNMPH